MTPKEFEELYPEDAAYNRRRDAERIAAKDAADAAYRAQNALRRAIAVIAAVEKAAAVGRPAMQSKATIDESRRIVANATPAEIEAVTQPAKTPYRPIDDDIGGRGYSKVD